jgi:aspartate ammonia-lyase
VPVRAHKPKRQLGAYGDTIKIADDLRLLNLLGEIELPELQVGSSIMPGKVNPVALEAAIQVGLKVMANDFLVAEACSRSTLQINEFLPLLAHSLLESLDILIRMNQILASHVEGIAANEAKCREAFDQSPMIITAFLPHIGYDRAAALLKEFFSSGKKNVREFLSEKLGPSLVEKILSPDRLISLGYRENGRAAQYLLQLPCPNRPRRISRGLPRASCSSRR